MSRISAPRLSSLFELVNGVDSRIGIEKETLRVSPQGHIAQTPHPMALGSALTHPYITTDYSEALLELITPPLPDLEAVLNFLRDSHQFVYQNIDEEMLWAASMPCVLDGEHCIPIARYGHSNAGLMKHIYRVGLGHRYGRLMQVIAGVHFNFSLSDTFWATFQDQQEHRGTLRNFKADRYFGLIRNLQRYGWLIPYLFGASPAVCKSFLAGKPTVLEEFDVNTYFGPYATSLRVSDIGYTNSREKKTGLAISYDDVDSYIASLTWAIETPCPAYQKIGIKVAGEYRQLNANILQIENEYYSTVRPKQPPQGNEKPTLALRDRGVEYVELRSLDVNPFEPLGVNLDQLRFLKAFLTFCLLQDSLRISADERREIDHNQIAVANCGRDPTLVLQCQGHSEPLRRWALEILEPMQGLCEILDGKETDGPYNRTLALQTELVRDPDRTPSARILAEMRKNGEGFFAFAMRISEQHRQYFRDLAVMPERMQYFAEEARRSLNTQGEMETADDISFDEYLRQYFAQT